MVLDRAHLDAQSAGDLLLAKAVVDQVDDLPFTGRQLGGTDLVARRPAEGVDPTEQPRYATAFRARPEPSGRMRSAA